MNRLIIYLLLFVTLLYSASCKKDSKPASDAAAFKKPCSVLYNFDYNGTAWVRNGYMLLDLDHADNKDKSFMVVDVQSTGIGEFAFVLKRGPLPIDSLATNWPTAVRYVAFGYSNDMTVSASMRMQSQTTGARFTYRYDSIHKFSSGIYMYNYLNNPLYAGSMAGKQPQGRTGSWVADANDQAIPRDVIYYFKEMSYSSVVSPGNGGKLLTELVGDKLVSAEWWKRVDAVLTVEGYYYQHLYFDFDTWEYFSVRDWCPSVYGSNCDKGGVQVLNWKSMNSLMQWPQGWGKQ